jgi:cysteine desulfurase
MTGEAAIDRARRANAAPVYLDYQATTPTDPRVVAAMLPYFTEKFGNPHSTSHRFGREAAAAVEQARGEVAALIGVEPREIVFTSGATESNNAALKGAMRFLRDERRAERDHIVTLETELVSVMAVNNEIGVIQNLAAIGALCRAHGVLFHSDAAQAVGKIPLDVETMHIDLLSISGHKLYGPKGIGALYVRRKPRVRIEAQIHGGGHERGFRSGTLATHQIVGFGEAARLAKLEMATDNERIRALRDRLLKGLSDVEEIYVNGDLERRIPHNLNVSFNFVEGESLIMAIKDIAVSSGSACTSASLEPSYVLRALGRNDELAHSSIRITLGRFTTAEEVDYAAGLIKSKVGKLRELSPLWEMYKEGIDLNSVQWAAH